jgi:hypothetical protein
MRIPVEPLPPLDPAGALETDVRIVEAAGAARRVGAEAARPRDYVPAKARGPAWRAQEQAAESVDEYQGTERRQSERRVVAKSALIDTRLRPDRRRQAKRAKVDIEV